MKKFFGIISTILFIVGLASYVSMYFGSYDSVILAGMIASVIGLILAFFADKGIYRRIGLFGNAIVLSISLILPFIVTTFFWNQP